MVALETRIKYNGVRVRLRGFGFRKLQHLRLLTIGIKAVKARLARGLDENDAQSKPLSRGYAIAKSKNKFRKPIRNLDFTGELLAGIKPRYADDHQALADASGRLGRMKARLYRDLLRFSPGDQAQMSKEAGELFKTNVEQVIGFPGSRKNSRGRSPDRASFSRESFGRR